MVNENLIEIDEIEKEEDAEAQKEIYDAIPNLVYEEDKETETATATDIKKKSTKISTILVQFLFQCNF